MSDHTQLIAQVAARNPVPNLDDPPIGAWEVDVVRAEVTERDTNMLTDKRPTKTVPAPAVHRRGWRVALASFTIVLLAAGGLWLATRTTSPGEVAGQPPTTNAPANEQERIALETMVAFFTYDEAKLDALSTATSADTIAIVKRELGLDRALNARTDAVTCTASSVANVTVNCTFLVNNDLLAALGIRDHPQEMNISVRDGGWTDIFFERNIEAEPNLEAYVRDTNSGLFAEGGPCFWRPEIDPATVDWDACASGIVEFIEGWMAETGRS